MSEKSDFDFWVGFAVGSFFFGVLTSIIWGIATRQDELVRQSIERRGYDVEALSKEAEVEYWKALAATGRVADPQPVEEVDGGR